MKKFLQTLMLVAVLALPWASQAQSLSEYGFSTGVDASKWITLPSGSTSLIAASAGDYGVSTVHDLGFTFPFGENDYTQFSVNADGNLKLGSSVTGTGNYSSPFTATNAAVNNPKINMLGCDGFLGPNGHVYAVHTVNAAGDSVMVIEFATSTYTTTSRDQVLSWQVQLYHTGRILIAISGNSITTQPAVARQPGLCVDATDGWVITSDAAAQTFTNGYTSTTFPSGTWFTPGRYYEFSRPSMTCPAPADFAISDIGATSVTVGWTPRGTESSWLVSDGTNETETYATTYTFDNLTPSTDYVFTVRALCGAGDSSSVRMLSTTTRCIAVPGDSLPYAYGFEDATGSGAAYAISNCWERYQFGTTTLYPYPSSTNKHSGGYGLYFYSTSTIDSWAVLPDFEEDLNQLQLSFWAYKTSANYGHLIVGVMTNPDDLSTFDTLALVNVNNTSTWEYFEVPMSSYTGNGTHLAIRSSSSAASYTYVDDIVVDYLPSCVRPENISATNATEHSVDLDWTSSASEWVVEYGPAGFQQGQGTEVSAYGTPFTLTGLASGTNYGAYITSVCGTDSSTAAYVAFSTACGTLSLPYSNDFESYATGTSAAFPNCFTRINDATGTSNYYPYVNTSTTSAHSGTKYMYFYRSTTATYADNEYMVLPPVDTVETPISNLEFSFFARYGTNTNPLIVGVMIDPADTSTFTPIQTINVDQQTYQLYTVSLRNYTGYGSYVALKYPRYTTSSAAYLYLDDIQLYEGSNCATPMNVAVSGVSSDGFSISWTDTANVGSYLVYYGMPGFDPDTVTPEMVNTTSFTTTAELQPLTTYEVFVVADCGGEQSYPSFPIQVLTACAAIDSLPYVEDFETYSSGSTNSISPCWVKGTTSSTAYPYPYSTSAISGNISLYFYSTSSYYSYAALPLFETSIDQLRLRFKTRNYSTISSTYGSRVVVGVMSNPHDINTFEPYQVVDNGAAGVNAIVDNEIFFDSYTGNGGFIAIMAPTTSGLGFSTNYIRVDDVIVDPIPACRRSTNLVAENVTAYSADLAWHNPSENVNSYTVAYSTDADFDPATCTTTVTVYDTTATLTSLTPYTRYYYAVTANCDGNPEWSAIASFRTLLDCGDGFANILDTIGNGTSSAYTYTMYNYTSYPSGYSAAIYTADEMVSMGLSGNNTINSISLHCGATGGTTPNVKIYMKETDFAGFATTSIAGDTAALFSGMTEVYSGSIVAVAEQWVEIPLDSAFHYNGTGNLLVRFVRSSAPTASATFYYTSTSPDYLSCAGYRSSATTANFTATRYNYRTNLAFNICSEIPSCERPMNYSLATISDSYAEVHWTGESNGSYEYILSTNNQFDSTAATTSITGDSVMLTGLSANTTYYFWARQNCGSGSMSDWSVVYSFTTPCAPVDLPYTEDFESYASSSTSPIDPCWTRHAVGTTTQYPYPSSTAGINSTRGLYFYSYRPSTATSTAYYDWASLPMVNAPLDSVEFRFDMKRYSSTSANYTTEIYVGVMVDPDDISTFDTVAYFDMRNDASGTVRSFEVSFDQYAGRGRFITLLLPPQPFTGTASYSYAYIDNIEVVRMSNCRRPANVAVVDSTITTNSAYITFTDRMADPMGYEVSLVPYGGDPADGIITPTNAAAVQVTGLAPSTHYAAYARVICGIGDTSDWSVPTYFHTLCAPITNLPLTYTFEGDATGTSSPLPYCWTRYNDGTTYDYYPYINNTTTYAHSGSNVLYFYSPTTTGTYGDTLMAVLPEIDATIPTSSIEVSFWGRISSSTYSNSEVQVGILSDPTDPSTFVPSGSFHFTTEHQFYTIDLAGNTSNGHYVAFMMTRQSSAQYAYIDDITIDRGSACPRAFALGCTAVTTNSAVLSWSDTAYAAGYVVEYWPDNDPAAVSTTSSATNSVIINGLTPSTFYTYVVKSLCQLGDTAMPSREPGHFATTQIPASLPYSYDFENAAEWNSWQTSSNNNVAWYRGTAAAGQGQYSMYISANNGATVGTNLSQIVNAVAYRDVDFGPNPSSFTLTFKASVGGSTDGAYDGVSVILADPAISVVSSATGLMTPWGHINDVNIRLVRRDTSWATYEAYFDNISGVQRVAFYWFNQATASTHPFENGPAAIDDITIEQMACQRPYDLYVDNLGTTSATLHWSGESTANYTIVYREYPGTPSMNQTITTTGNSYTLAGLNSNTEYAFWVLKDCSATLQSPSSVGIRFSTVCNIYSAADTIRENFSGLVTGSVAYNAAGVLPECWVGLSNGTSDLYIPHVVNSGTYWYAHDTNAVIMTSGSETYGDTKILRLPYTAEPVNSLTLSYWMCTESNTYGVLSVGYMTGESMDDFVPIRSIPASSATYHSSTGNQAAGVGVYDTVSFEGVPASAQYVAFKWYYNTSFYSVCIDDIELTSSNVCAAPVVTVSNVDYESADLSWAGTGIGYEVALTVHGEDWPVATAITSPLFHATALYPNTEYDYRVRQICDSAATSMWTEGSFTTADLPCFAPTNVTTSNATVNSISVAWTNGSQSNAQTWIVNVFNATTNIMDTVRTNPATITGLYDNTEYHVAVKSQCAALVSSDWSDTISFTTTSCQAVSNVNVTDITTSGAKVTWTAGANETAWEVSYGEMDFAEGQGVTVAATTTTYVITGLQADSRYDVYVRAKCADGITSDWSPVQQFQTLGNSQGIDGVEGNYSLSIYPNPTAGNTTISLRGVEGEVVITVVDMNGREITRDVMNCGSDCVKTMNVEGLAQGTYFVRVLGEGISSVRKLVVR
ncbi:MAG: fibronectin type III domain-containing protein [Bacteroidales bacterium]|nr:fibronectin type III domain-containing protein [Bacteroidales bacterium]